MIRKSIFMCAAFCLIAVFSACNDDDPMHHIEGIRLINITPSTGSAGEAVTVLGTNFGATAHENSISINGIEAQILNASSGEIRFLLPPNEPGSYTVKVRTGNKEAEGLKFTYLRTTSKTYLVNTIVGIKGNGNTLDGIGTAATTKLPSGLAFAPDGSIWFTERGNKAIRRLGADMTVTTLVSGEGLDNPWQGGFDPAGNYYVASKANGKVFKITPELKCTEFASGINNPMGCVCDEQGNVYVASRDAKKIIRYTPDGVSSDFITFASLKPNCLLRDKNGNFFVAGSGFYKILMVTPSGEQITIAGNGDKGTGIEDGEAGNPQTASIGSIFGLGMDDNGTLYICDDSYDTIRILTPDADGDYSKGTLETIAGSGTAGYKDGNGLKAAFNGPYAVLPTGDGKTIYVADATNYLIRSISVR